MYKILLRLTGDEYSFSTIPEIIIFIKECYSESEYNRILFETDYIINFGAFMRGEKDEMWVGDDDEIYIKRLKEKES